MLFSSEPYDPAAPLPAASTYSASPAHHHKPQHTMHDRGVHHSLTAPPPPPASHVTNYAQNANSLVWGLDQLQAHLGPATWAALWPSLCGACARALGAARGALAEATAWLRPAVQEYGFQVGGDWGEKRRGSWEREDEGGRRTARGGKAAEEEG